MASTLRENRYTDLKQRSRKYPVDLTRVLYYLWILREKEKSTSVKNLKYS